MDRSGIIARGRLAQRISGGGGSNQGGSVGHYPDDAGIVMQVRLHLSRGNACRNGDDEVLLI